MMYINIKKLYSWRIRPYKIPSFFFPLLFPFFLSFLLPPFFLSSPLMVCECAPALAQVVKKSFSNQKVVSSVPCRSVLEHDTKPLIAPDVQCAISVNVKCVYIVCRTYVSCFG